MSYVQFLLLLSVLPSIILGKYIYDNDRISKEPNNLLAKLVLYGIFSTILTLILSSLLEYLPFIPKSSSNLSTIGLIVYCFFKVGFIEEFSKWIFVRLATWNNKEFDHIYDAIVYCVFVSLGFATLENILYVVSGGIIVALLRAVLSVPGHVFFGVFMGYYYGIGKQGSINRNTKIETKNLTLSLIVPTLLHGFFDFCLLASNFYLIIIYFIFVIFLYYKAFKKVKQLAGINQNFTEEITPKVALYCSNCGTELKGPYCGKCGKKMN